MTKTNKRSCFEVEGIPAVLAADAAAGAYLRRLALAAIARRPDAAFGERKVFLGALGVDWTLPDHRAALIAMARSGVVRLARADYVAAMDPALVAASEVDLGGATAHFLEIA
jgi:hypothetical protein